MSQGGPLGVGVVGIGFGQAVHVPAFRQVPGCEVVALAASEPGRAEAIAGRLGVPGAPETWRQLVESPAVHLVSIAVPPDVQPEIAVAALEAGKAVFCEKPLALDVAGARRVLAAAEASGGVGVVDFEFPELAPFRRLRDELAAGSIGALRHLEVTWNVETYANARGLVSWKTDPARGGGILHAFGCHVLEYVERLVQPIRRLSARLSRAPGDPRDTTTLARLDLELASGAPGVVVVCSHAYAGTGHRVACYGEEGSLVLENPGGGHVQGFRLTHARRGRSAEVLDPEVAGVPDGGDERVGPVARLARRLVEGLRAGTPPSPGLEVGLRIQELLAAAQRSHDTGTWQEVP